MAVSAGKFIKEVKTELKQVTWPTKQEVLRMTTAVIAISLVAGIYLGLLDFGFTKLIELIVKK